MKPLLLSWYCVNECDRPKAQEPLEEAIKRRPSYYTWSYGYGSPTQVRLSQTPAPLRSLVSQDDELIAETVDGSRWRWNKDSESWDGPLQP